MHQHDPQNARHEGGGGILTMMVSAGDSESATTTGLLARASAHLGLQFLPCIKSWCSCEAKSCAWTAGMPQQQAGVAIPVQASPMFSPPALYVAKDSVGEVEG